MWPLPVFWAWRVLSPRKWIGEMKHINIMNKEEFEEWVFEKYNMERDYDSYALIGAYWEMYKKGVEDNRKNEI